MKGLELGRCYCWGVEGGREGVEREAEGWGTNFGFSVLGELALE